MFTVKNIKTNNLKQIMNLPNKPKVLAATYNPVSDTKMISFLVDFPTVLLAELRTHRIITQGSLYEHMELDNFNMSANSARAIPQNKYLEKILNNPFVPIWTKQQKGMSGELLKSSEFKIVNEYWFNNLDELGENTTFESEYVPLKELGWQTLLDNYNNLIKEGIHKQNANRLLAPFAYTTCILTGTEWENFFSLRISENAQPEFMIIATMLKELYDNVDWKENKYHIPFQEDIENLYCEYLNTEAMPDENEYYNTMMLISASMCAKLSYNTQDNIDTLEKHLERANMLIEHKHSEPFSHQAVAMDEDDYFRFVKGEILKTDITHNDDGSIVLNITEDDGIFGWCYNLNGFISQRYILENY